MNKASCFLPDATLNFWHWRARPRIIGKSAFMVLLYGASWFVTVPQVAAQNETIVAWGYNDYDQCTVPPSLDGSDVAALAGGLYHSLALLTDGTVVPWGGGWAGDESELPEDLINVVAIATGTDHNLALTADGVVAAWGLDNYLQCWFVDGMSNAVAIAAARHHSLVLQSDGVLIGKGQYLISYTTNVVGGVAIASGYAHDLVLKFDGTVMAPRGAATPAGTVPAGLDNVMTIAAGSSHSLALQSNGTVVVWGNTTEPPGLTNVVAIAAKAGHSLALKSDGTVVAWGSNAYDESIVPAELNNAVLVGAGVYHSLSLGEYAAETGPMLQVTGSVSTVTLSWEPDTPGWVLQTSDNLVSNEWTNATSGSNNPVAFPATQPAVYFRLYKP